MINYCCWRKSILFNDTATTDIYTHSLHDALPISSHSHSSDGFELKFKLNPVKFPMKAHADHLADAGMEAMKTFLILLVGLLSIGAHMFLIIIPFTLRSPRPMLIVTLTSNDQLLLLEKEYFI